MNPIDSGKRAPSLEAIRRTKIVCTIGPASRDDAILDAMIAAGMTVARINMSHGGPEEGADLLARIRRRAAASGVTVAILVDLQGPKVRTGSLAGGGPVRLEAGQRFTITIRPVPGDADVVSTGYAGLPAEVGAGDRILLSDGLIELRAERVEPERIECRVLEGGELRERQGISVAGADLGLASLTEKDVADLRWAVSAGADYLAVSFVRRADDLVAAHRLVAEAGGAVPLIAKIEKPSALEHLDAILDASDGVMVARGDMGIELPPEEVPVWQKRIIDAANAALKPVITATQMLESMVREPRPTRAEATDVANAIWDGTDAVMLSAETSIGAHPVEAVAMIDRIARVAEREPDFLRRREIARRPEDIPHAISLGVYHAVREMAGVRAIAAFTRNGATAELLSKDRPPVPIIGFCADEGVARRLALFHGVTPIPVEETRSLPEMIRVTEEYGARSGALAPGDMVALVGHLPLDLPGSTNFLMLHRIGASAGPDDPPSPS